MCCAKLSPAVLIWTASGWTGRSTTKTERCFWEDFSDAPEQLTLLNQLVAATIGENEVRKRQFAEVCPADPAHFRLLPIDSFLQCIQELIPWFAELDGVTIHRAYHHADGKFTLVAVTDHESQKEALSSILGRELGSVEQGRLRLQENPLIRRADGEIKAVVMEAESQSIERDPFQAMAILSTGWQLYHKQRYHEATELLDGGLRFDPKSPYLWYLRSLCYLGLGKIRSRSARCISRC